MQKTIKEPRLPIKIALWVGTVWFFLFAFMWAGYLVLSFLGLVPDAPTTQYPHVPFIPGFNDNLPTTTTIPWAPSG